MRWVDEGEHTNIYRCGACGRWRPWCDGAADDMPEVCDRCWSIAHKPWWWRILRRLGLVRIEDHGCGECVLEPTWRWT